MASSIDSKQEDNGGKLSESMLQQKAAADPSNAHYTEVSGAPSTAREQQQRTASLPPSQPSRIRIARDGSIRVNVGRRRRSSQERRTSSAQPNASSRGGSARERTFRSQNRKLENLQDERSPGNLDNTVNRSLNSSSFLSPNRSGARVYDPTYSTISTRNTTLDTTDDSVKYIRERIERVNRGMEEVAGANDRAATGTRAQSFSSFSDARGVSKVRDDTRTSQVLSDSFYADPNSSVHKLSETSQQLLKNTHERSVRERVANRLESIRSSRRSANESHVLNQSEFSEGLGLEREDDSTIVSATGVRDFRNEHQEGNHSNIRGHHGNVKEQNESLRGTSTVDTFTQSRHSQEVSESADDNRASGDTNLATEHGSTFDATNKSVDIYNKRQIGPAEREETRVLGWGSAEPPRASEFHKSADRYGRSDEESIRHSHTTSETELAGIAGHDYHVGPSRNDLDRYPGSEYRGALEVESTPSRSHTMRKYYADSGNDRSANSSSSVQKEIGATIGKTPQSRQQRTRNTPESGSSSKSTPESVTTEEILQVLTDENAKKKGKRNETYNEEHTVQKGKRADSAREADDRRDYRKEMKVWRARCSSLKKVYDAEVSAREEASKLYEEALAEVRGLRAQLSEYSNDSIIVQKEKEIRRLKHSLQVQEESVQGVKKQLDERTALLENAEYKLSEANSKINDLENRVVKISEHKVNKADQTVSRLSQRIQSLEEENNELRAQCRTMEEQQQQSQSTIEYYKEQLSNAQDDSKDQRRKRDQLEEELVDERAKVQKAQEELEISKDEKDELRSQVDSLRENVSSRDSRITDIQQQLESKDSELQKAHSSLADRENTISNYKSNVSDLEAKLNEMKRNHDEVLAQCESKDTELKTKDQEINANQEKLEQLRNEIQEWSNVLSQRDQQLKDVKGSRESLRADQQATKEELSSYKEKVSNLEEENVELKETIKIREERATEYERELEEKEKAVNRLQQQLKDVEQSNSRMESKVNEFENSASRRVKEIEQLNMRLEDYTGQLNRSNHLVQRLENEVRETEDNLDEMYEVDQRRRKELEQSKEEREMMSRKSHERYTELMSAVERMKMLQEDNRALFEWKQHYSEMINQAMPADMLGFTVEHNLALLKERLSQKETEVDSLHERLQVESEGKSSAQATLADLQASRSKIESEFSSLAGTVREVLHRLKGADVQNSNRLSGAEEADWLSKELKHECEEIIDQVQAKSDDVASLREKLQESHAENNQLKSSLRDTEERLRQRDDCVSDLQRKLSELNSSMSSAKDELDSIKKESQEEKERNSRLNKDYEDLQNSLEDVKRQLESTQQNLKDEKERHRNDRRELHRSVAEYRDGILMIIQGIQYFRTRYHDLQYLKDAPHINWPNFVAYTANELREFTFTGESFEAIENCIVESADSLRHLDATAKENDDQNRDTRYHLKQLQAEREQLAKEKASLHESLEQEKEAHTEDIRAKDMQLKETQEDLREKTNEVVQLEQKLEHLQNDKEDMGAVNEKLNERLHRLDSTLRDLRGRYSSMSSNVRISEQRLAQYRITAEQTQMQAEDRVMQVLQRPKENERRVSSELENMGKENSWLSEQVERKNEELQSLKNKVNELEQSQEGSEKRAREIEEEHMDNKQYINQLLSQKETEEARSKEFEVLLESIKKERNQLQQSRDNIERQLERALEDSQDYQNQLSQETTRCSRLQEENDSLQDMYDRVCSELDNVKSKRRSAVRKLINLSSNRSSEMMNIVSHLRQELSSLREYVYGIQRVLEEKTPQNYLTKLQTSLIAQIPDGSSISDMQSRLNSTLSDSRFSKDVALSTMQYYNYLVEVVCRCFTQLSGCPVYPSQLREDLPSSIEEFERVLSWTTTGLQQKLESVPSVEYTETFRRSSEQYSMMLEDLASRINEMATEKEEVAERLHNSQERNHELRESLTATENELAETKSRLDIASASEEVVDNALDSINELKDEVDYYRNQLTENENTIYALRDEIRQLTRRNTTLESQLTGQAEQDKSRYNVEAESENTYDGVEGIQSSHVAQRDESRSELEQHLREKESELSRLREMIRHTERNDDALERSSDELEVVKVDRDGAREEVKKLHGQLSAVQQHLNDTITAFQAHKSRIQAVSDENSSLKAQVKRMEEVQNATTMSNGDASYYAGEFSSQTAAEREVQRLRSVIEVYERSVSDIQHQVSSLSSSLREKDSRVQELYTEKGEFERQVSSMNYENERLRNKISELKISIDSLFSNHVSPDSSYNTQSGSEIDSDAEVDKTQMRIKELDRLIDAQSTQMSEYQKVIREKEKKLHDLSLKQMQQQTVSTRSMGTQTVVKDDSEKAKQLGRQIETLNAKLGAKEKQLRRLSERNQGYLLRLRKIMVGVKRICQEVVSDGSVDRKHLEGTRKDVIAKVLASEEGSEEQFDKKIDEEVDGSIALLRSVIEEMLERLWHAKSYFGSDNDASAEYPPDIINDGEGVASRTENSALEDENSAHNADNEQTQSFDDNSTVEFLMKQQEDIETQLQHLHQRLRGVAEDDNDEGRGTSTEGASETVDAHYHAWNSEPCLSSFRKEDVKQNRSFDNIFQKPTDDGLDSAEYESDREAECEEQIPMYSSEAAERVHDANFASSAGDVGLRSSASSQCSDSVDQTSEHVNSVPSLNIDDNQANEANRARERNRRRENKRRRTKSQRSKKRSSSVIRIPSAAESQQKSRGRTRSLHDTVLRNLSRKGIRRCGSAGAISAEEWAERYHSLQDSVKQKQAARHSRRRKKNEHARRAEEAARRRREEKMAAEVQHRVRDAINEYADVFSDRVEAIVNGYETEISRQLLRLPQTRQRGKSVSDDKLEGNNERSEGSPGSAELRKEATAAASDAIRLLQRQQVESLKSGICPETAARLLSGSYTSRGNSRGERANASKENAPEDGEGSSIDYLLHELHRCLGLLKQSGQLSPSECNTLVRAIGLRRAAQMDTTKQEARGPDHQHSEVPTRIAQSLAELNVTKFPVEYDD